MKTTIPRSVQRASDAADELLKQQQAAREAAPLDGGDPPAPPAADPPPQPISTPPANATAELETERQRYRTLQAKYNAEVPQLAAELRRANEENTQLRSSLGEIRRELDELKQQSTRATAIAPSKAIRERFEKFAEEAGDEDLTAVLRGTFDITDELLEKNARLEAELNTIKNVATEARQDQIQSKEERFWAAIDAFPNKAKINEDPAFQAWMSEVDPIYLQATGVSRSRQQSIVEARDAFDAPRALRFYEEWTRLSAKPPGAKEPSIDPPNGGGGEGSPPVDPNGKIYTRAEISQFFKDARNGLYDGKEEEFKRIDKDILQAQVEGRIRG